MEWQRDAHQGCEFLCGENLVEIGSVDASQRGGTVDAEEGGKEGLRSHEKRTKLWVNPFSRNWPHWLWRRFRIQLTRS